MEKFIYVFSSNDKDALLAAGYTLLKCDEKKELYVFAAQDNLEFSLADMSFVRSDTLTF